MWKMKRRGFIRTLSYMTAALAVMLGFTIEAYNGQRRLEAEKQELYRRSLQDSADLVRNISVTLGKGADAGRGVLSRRLTAALIRDAGAAKAALSSLPLTDGERMAANKLLTQVSDYSASLERAGENLTARQRDTLLDLREYVLVLENELSERLNGASDGSWTGADVPAGEATALEESFTDYPSMIYDGPFSDHMLEREPLLTQDLLEISPDEALRTAAMMLLVDEGFLTRGTDEASRMPSYTFTLGENLSAAVTKAGGLPVYMADGRPVGEEAVSEEDARGEALLYLAYLGLPELEETAALRQDGILRLQYACVQDGVVCYPDQVKVGIALDTGEVVFFDAREYIMNHHERSLPAVNMEASAARDEVSSFLDVRHVRQVLIPTSGGGEAFCHEFYGVDADGREMLCYVNALTGAQEELLELVRTDEGVLTR